MQKKIFAWAMSMAVAAMITCTGCTQNNNSSGTDSGSSTAQTTTLDDNDTAEAAVGQSLSAIQSGEAGVTTDEDDLCDNYDAFDAEITLEDGNTKVKGNTKAVSVKDNCITISAGGTYRAQRQADQGTSPCDRLGKSQACIWTVWRSPVPPDRLWSAPTKNAPFCHWRKVHRTL